MNSIKNDYIGAGFKCFFVFHFVFGFFNRNIPHVDTHFVARKWVSQRLRAADLGASGHRDCDEGRSLSVW